MKLPIKLFLWQYLLRRLEFVRLTLKLISERRFFNSSHMINNKIYFYLFLIGFTSLAIVEDLSSQQLSSMFSDHMVLQRDQAVPVWGTAIPGEVITVSFDKQSKSAIADQDGQWMIQLNPMDASSEGRDMVIIGKESKVISDVLVGEVWICSGQSNMQWSVSNVPEAKGLIPFAKKIRSFEVDRTVSFSEAEDVNGHWKDSYPNSAVAFSFAYFLEEIGDVPVGIILTAWGSSSLEAWMPKHLTTKLPYFKTIMDDFDKDTETHRQIADILTKEKDRTRQEDIFLRRQPNILYNAMMNPISPYACRGVVWYQGERNTRYLSGMPEVTQENWFHRVAGMKEYGSVLKEWALSYRELWDNDKLDFMIIMLPGFGRGTAAIPEIDPEDPATESWAWIRESQMQILDLPHTSVINTIDLGDVKNIHPSDKLPIGQRLALMASKNYMNNRMLTSGPVMDKVEVADTSIIVHFKNAEGLKTTNGSMPSAFWLSNDSGQWKPADAHIDRSTVILSSSEIDHPKYVRYAFAGKPKVNLVNKIELPAYPFRTDTFEK